MKTTKQHFTRKQLENIRYNDVQKKIYPVNSARKVQYSYNYKNEYFIIVVEHQINNYKIFIFDTLNGHMTVTRYSEQEALQYAEDTAKHLKKCYYVFSQLVTQTKKEFTTV